MKIKKLIYVLVGTLVVASSCSDTEFGNGKEGTGTEPAASSPLVKVYADEKGEHLLAGNILVKEGAPRTITLNVPIHTEKVYMEYNTVSGAVKRLLLLYLLPLVVKLIRPVILLMRLAV